MKNKVKFEVQMIDVSYLVELVPKIPKEVKDQFAKEYGKLLDLILVPIDADALRVMGAMAKYWSPILRIFEFPNVDASPTIEEYEVLLDIPLSNRLRVYLFTGTQDANEDIIKELIGSETGRLGNVQAITSISHIRGCLTFTPALVLGQMKWGMTPVREEQLQGFVIWYKDREATDKTLDAVRKNIPDADIPPKPAGPSETELLLTGQIKVLGAKLEETRDQKEKHELTIEKLYKIIDAQKKEEISLKRDYANMCSTSEKYSLLRAVKNKDEKIAKLISANEEKDKQISDLNHQLKIRSRALHTAQMDIQVLEVKAEKLQAISQDAKNEENHAWATMKEYQAALDKTLERENQLKAIMEEMEKAHHQALTEANDDKVYLSEQLTLLEATHKELVTRQQEWSHNWDNMLQECKWDKDRWEERCRRIIDGFGDFADGWLRTFEEARGELHMYPETELRPAMKTFYETCDGLAWKLRKWRIAATGDF
ncbi:hypothetical protein Lal_00021378 [Lupinus albus]|nr:hypothetical protein Lal_00021378 [Lupinus albus]